ncbi:regulatory LuxR family protein [Solirubrobacter pauli]|uniref:Regulatory LuxR family protein n=1 Tax=Solirubrobacter pauli TaxID=166793 RepID=A0A660LGF1_9ACTN|nr:AAA family ATPase [Solirubrobacter pauli]RKQ92004.1 regulatory LuxR family protein [Solirubrobacter pauli]
MLLGRDTELSAIARALDGLDAGHGGFLAFGGEPGIGKSAVLDVLAEQARVREHRVLRGRATEFERLLPFGALVDALDPFLEALEPGRLERMGVTRRDELAAVFPALDGSLDAVPEAYRLHRALRALLDGIAGSRPLVLVLDDLQWADDSTREALSALVRRPPAGRVLIAVAHRPDAGLDDLGHQLDRHGHPRLRLGPLSADDAQTLVAGRVSGATLRAVLEQADGNPFYLEQLARSPARGPLPSAVASSIQAEIEQLSYPAQALLRGAAVAGEPADLRLARIAAGLDERAALDAVDEAQRAELLRPVEGAAAFTFRHPIVRRAAYESAGPGWRINAHGRLRTALIELGADVTVVAQHVRHGATLGDEQGIAILTAAAERVVDRAPADAAAWLEAALRLLPEQAGERFAELQARRGTALLLAGELAAAREALLAAGTDTAEKCWRLAEVERWLGHEQEAVRRLARARELASDDPRVQVKVEIELVLVHEWNLRYDAARRAAQAGAARAASSGDPVLIAEVEGVIATTLVQTDPRAAAGPYAHAATAIAGYDDHDFPAHPMSLWDLGWAATHLERYDEAIAHFERGLRIARARRAHGNVAMFLTDRVEPRFRAGRLREALELAEEAVEAARVTPSVRYEWWALARLGLLLGRSGDGPRAAEVVRDCERAATGLPQSPLVDLWTAQASATATFALGDRSAAAARLLAAAGSELQRMAPVDRSRSRLVVLEAALERGDRDDAERWADDADAWALFSGLSTASAWALVGRSHLAATGGRLTDAARTAEAAIDAYARVGARLEAERARTLYGRWLGEAGVKADALAALERAEERLHALGADQERAVAVRELRKLGRRAPRRDAAPAGGRLAGLSARESEVAALVADGATNQAVADALFLSVKTVESHLRNIFAKTGVSSREALAATVREQG